MKGRIAISGGTGLIGKALSESLYADGYEVISLARNVSKSRSVLPFASEHYEFAPSHATTSEWKKAIEGATSVINLSGESIAGKRWTEERKNEIIRSRVLPTVAIATAISELSNPPRSFISASAVGYYGNSPNSVLDENSPEGIGFLAQVCSQWESASAKAASSCRVVNPRIGMVLAPNGGALQKMLAPFKLFLGGALGSGNQWVSWIHIADLVAIFKLLIEDDSVAGAVNAVAPNPVRMREFAKGLGRALHRPSLFHIPTAMLRLALGESADIVISSQCVWPRIVTDRKFRYAFPELPAALADVVSVAKAYS